MMSWIAAIQANNNPDEDVRFFFLLFYFICALELKGAIRSKFVFSFVAPNHSLQK